MAQRQEPFILVPAVVLSTSNERETKGQQQPDGNRKQHHLLRCMLLYSTVRRTCSTRSRDKLMTDTATSTRTVAIPDGLSYLL